MKYSINRISVAFALIFSLMSASSRAVAADAYPLFTDVNVNGLGFGNTDAFTFGGFGQDDTAVFNGNDILVQSTNFTGVFNDGAGISLPLSNGENGYTETFDTLNSPNDTSNPDIDNTTPPNPVFTTIGNVIPPANSFPPSPVTGTPNPRVGLNNGNVLRYSMWVRIDPNDPIIGPAVQIEPVLKFEFFKEALSIAPVDNNGGAQTTFGDKVYDTDQQEGDGVWIDIDGSGSTIDTSATFANGRLKSVTTTEWTLIEVVHEVDDTDWFGIDDDIYTVADIEEIRAVMFWGDFDGGDHSGSLWFDNVLLEVFADSASVTPNANPDPALSEGIENADFNTDFIVDGTDFLIAQQGFGTGTTLAEGDANGSGSVDGADIAIFQNQYGTVIPNIGSVPEPASAGLVLVSMMCLAGTRLRS